MSEPYITICQFDSGVQVTRKIKYADFKAAILRVGKFSVFEATETARAARLFTDLCKDPEVEIETVGFPWTLVRVKQL